jgi:hypothetical protein
VSGGESWTDGSAFHKIEKRKRKKKGGNISFFFRVLYWKVQEEEVVDPPYCMSTIR